MTDFSALDALVPAPAVAVAAAVARDYPVQYYSGANRTVLLATTTITIHSSTHPQLVQTDRGELALHSSTPTAAAAAAYLVPRRRCLPTNSPTAAAAAAYLVPRRRCLPTNSQSAQHRPHPPCHAHNT
jgi:hypothetical protein